MRKLGIDLGVNRLDFGTKVTLAEALVIHIVETSAICLRYESSISNVPFASA